MALPTFLNGRAKSQFMSIKNDIWVDGINLWPEADQFFIRSYPTPNVIRDEINVLRKIRNQSTEDELKYVRRLSSVFELCRNVHEKENIMTMFLTLTFWWNSSSILMLIACFKEGHNHDEIKFALLIQKAKEKMGKFSSSHGKNLCGTIKFTIVTGWIDFTSKGNPCNQNKDLSIRKLEINIATITTNQFPGTQH